MTGTPSTLTFCTPQERTLPDGEAVHRAAELFKILSDPNRVRLIALLAQGETCVHDLAHLLGVTPSAVSHQLRLLRHQGLVQARRQGQHVFYRLKDEHVYRLLQQALEHAECR